MAEITLKFDPKNPIAKKTIDYILSLGVFVAKNKVEQDKTVVVKKSYNPEFVEMVKKAERSKNRTVIDPKNVWERLGLK